MTTSSVTFTTPADTGSVSALSGSANYGLDVSTFVVNDVGEPDLDPYFILIGGNRVLGEQLLRGLLMDKGEMWDAPDEGADVRLYLSSRFDSRGVKASQVSGILQLECDGDERVEASSISISLDEAKHILRLAGRIEPVDTTNDPFQFIVLISALTAELLSPT